MKLERSAFTGLVLAFLGAVVISGCGKDGAQGQGDQGTSQASESAYQPNSTNCSISFVADYERVRNAIRHALSMSEVSTSNQQPVNEARSLLDQFADKYRDVRCTAEMTAPNQLNATQEQIDVNTRAEEWRALLTSMSSSSRPSNSVAPARSYSEW